MIIDPVAYSIDSLAEVSRNIPNMVVELSFLVMSGIIIVVFALAKDLNTARKGVISTSLVEYLFLVLCSTVIYRATTVGYKIDLMPFWSYSAIISGGHNDLIKENLMNVALGVPVGFLLSFIMIHQSWWKAGLVGFLFSSTIELSQLVFKRGLCEFDDVFHNTLGCLVGYGIGLLMMLAIARTRRA
jgi:glycopeptide antibiotics resistance protein